MGLSFANNAFRSAAAASTPNQNDRPSATVWLNIGMTVPLVQPDGTTVDIFVSLPVGLPLDTQEPMTAKGNNANWHQMVQAKYWLLSELQKAAIQMEPGSEEIVTGLEIQIKRVGGAAAEPVADANPFLAAMKARSLSVVK